MTDRIQRLNYLALTIVILYTIVVQKVLVTNIVVNPIVDSTVAFLSSIGFYRILVEIIYRIVSSSTFFLKLYWGRQYIAGLWYYTYTVEGKEVEPNKVFMGVWRFEQDLYRTRVTGFGLTENFVVRSRVRSITDVIENNGAYEVINIRTDRVDPDKEYYSKSSMLFDTNRKSLINYPLKIRGRTTIYGGVLSGHIHQDVLVKCEDAKTEDDAINALKEYMQNNNLTPISIVVK